MSEDSFGWIAASNLGIASLFGGIQTSFLVSPGSNVVSVSPFLGIRETFLRIHGTDLVFHGTFLAITISDLTIRPSFPAGLSPSGVTTNSSPQTMGAPFK